MPTPLVEFKNVTKRFGERTILDGIDLTIYEGEITTIIGKSGVGKSVFLKHIIGLLTPDAGEIVFMGQPLAAMSRKKRQAMKRQCSYMFQHNALFDSMTVFENIALPLREKTTLHPREIAQKVKDKMEQLELGEVGHKYPTQLSGGMQKRVALARALINEPKIVLFDEPTTGLDPIRKNAVLSMIAHYQQKFNFSAVLVSHDIPDVFYISDRIAIIDEARILFHGSPLQLEQTRQPVIDEFINSLELLKNDLTGLCTNSQLHNHFELAQRECVEQDKPFCILTMHMHGLDAVTERIGALAAHRVMETFARTWQTILARDIHVALYGRYTAVGVLPGISTKECHDIATVIARAPHQGHELFIEGFKDKDVTATLQMGCAPGDPEENLDRHIARSRANHITVTEVACTGRRN
ncbi:ABC transporter ATP-binding protein [Desulfoplanes formicivorans]|uniref:Diguanylate cyclase n=1 Tax=Desulfoplanes formicivorans TaxID=1592317 RepID=A0A194AIX7_9BACT|nr:ABC transporter ATP-binding protein [Desulfoplanes formicivorans]GAU08699.1 diguanylate cyclase [Desulfoplanes formicivorans]